MNTICTNRIADFWIIGPILDRVWQSIISHSVWIHKICPFSIKFGQILSIFRHILLTWVGGSELELELNLLEKIERASSLNPPYCPSDTTCLTCQTHERLREFTKDWLRSSTCPVWRVHYPSFRRPFTPLYTIMIMKQPFNCKPHSYACHQSLGNGDTVSM